jgi:nitrous oxidase accessory protein
MVMKKCCGMHALRIVVGITMLALLLASSANAATITVNASGGWEYKRIQDAIDNASNGDTILVSGGATTTLTYYENVNVNKQLILRGIGNPVVDAAGSGSAITLAADGITLEGFTVTGAGSHSDSPEAGIVTRSSNNTLSGNNASNNVNDIGISLSFSNNNTLIDNNASNNDIGICLLYSNNNTISRNNASNNGYLGILLEIYSKNNTLSGNNVSNNDIGIYLDSSNNNNNTLRGNTMTGNREHFDLGGDTDSDFDNDIDTSNLVDGRPIYYLIKASDMTYDSSSNAGTLYCISCVNVTIKNLNLNKNGDGIFFWNTSQSRIQNVSASNNYIGISMQSSSNNTLTGNKLSNNDIGISLYYSNNNKIYNNIFKNKYNFGFNYYSENKNIKWNTTWQSGTNIIGGSLLGGNFWAKPDGTGFSQTCKDVNLDGICDKSYTLDVNNIDYLPLAKDKIPPKSVSKLKNITYSKNYINWTWKDPKDIDFKKVMVFIDNKFKKNVSKGKRFYNATNFTANTRHTISTRTVDINGNINKTWTNRSAWTAK